MPSRRKIYEACVYMYYRHKYICTYIYYKRLLNSVVGWVYNLHSGLKVLNICKIIIKKSSVVLKRHSYRNPCPYGQKLGQSLFISLSWVEFFASKISRHRQELVVIFWSQIQTIRWNHKNIPTKLPELLVSHYRSVWSTVVLMEYNSSRIGQIQPSLCDCLLQTVQLLTIHVRIKRAAHNRWFPANPTTKYIANFPDW